jgi:hypothetical protein
MPLSGFTLMLRKESEDREQKKLDVMGGARLSTRLQYRVLADETSPDAVGWLFRLCCLYCFLNVRNRIWCL